MIFIFDSNIPIAFKITNHFDILETLFSSDNYDHELVMSAINLQECQHGLSDELKKFKRFKTETKQDTKLKKQITDYYAEFKKQYGDIHTSLDADFEFVMSAIMINPDIIVCNDRHLKFFFDKFKNKYGYKDMKCYTLSNFLELIRISFRKSFLDKKLLSANLDIYHEDEIPGLFKNMERAQCFVSDINPKWYQRRFHEIFGDYKQNAFKIYP